MTDILPEKKLCSGCGVCAEVCPHQSITMASDSEEFRYPVIDQEKCVSCGICAKLCPVVSPPQISQNTIALAAQNIDEDTRKASSSGGVFSALAEYVLTKGGIVCAAVYDEQQTVKHIIIEQPDGVESMRGAKYAQSVAELCFARIRKELSDGRYVLFVGTPCQTAGLSKYLVNTYKTLILVDMICHGVPSPKVWDRYLSERKKTDADGAEIKKINLRCKESGWSRYSYSVQVRYQNGSVYQVPQGQDVFMQGFVQDLYSRPSCSQCSFKGIERCSDLTLGDCWGIWDVAPDFDDNRGTSLLLIHSETGHKAWSEISSKFRTLPLSIEEAIAQNPSAVQSSPPHVKREWFFDHLDSAKSMTSLIMDGLYLQEEKGLFQRIREKISNYIRGNQSK